LEDYVNYQRKIHDVKPTRAILESRQKTSMSLAQRMSINRAVRQATVNPVHMEHVNNVYHLNRRIEDMYSLTERRKNPHDPTVYPVYQKRSSNLYRSALHSQLLEPWSAKASTRPTSAPVARRNPDGYRGWSTTRCLRNVFPADDFPLYGAYTLASIESQYAIYKKAIMGEIVENRLYREVDLRRLLRSYVQLAPLRDKEIVERVVADLKKELDVGP